MTSKIRSPVWAGYTIHRLCICNVNVRLGGEGSSSSTPEKPRARKNCWSRKRGMYMRKLWKPHLVSVFPELLHNPYTASLGCCRSERLPYDASSYMFFYISIGCVKRCIHRCGAKLQHGGYWLIVLYLVLSVSLSPQPHTNVSFESDDPICIVDVIDVHFFDTSPASAFKTVLVQMLGTLNHIG